MTQNDQPPPVSNTTELLTTSSANAPITTPILPNDILRQIIKFSPKTVLKNLMPVSKQVYEMTAPLLYESVFIDHRARTVLEGLASRGQPEASLYNRKRDLLKLVKHLEILEHDHSKTDSLVSNSPYLDFAFPIVETLQLDNRFCYASGVVNAHCPLLKDRSVEGSLIMLRCDNVSIKEAVARIPCRDGSDLLIITSRLQVTWARYASFPLLRGQNSTTIIIDPSLFHAQDNDSNDSYLRPLVERLAKQLFYIGEPITIVGFERGESRVERDLRTSLAQSQGVTTDEETLPPWRQSTTLGYFERRYIRMASSSNHNPEAMLNRPASERIPTIHMVKAAFDKITYMSLEDYAEDHLDERVIPRETLESWISTYPAKYGDLALPSPAPAT